MRVFGKAALLTALVFSFVLPVTAQYPMHNPVEDPGPSKARQSGAIRVGVARVKNSSTRSVNLGVVRDRLIKDLKRAKLDVVALDEDSAAGVRREARERDCDYIVTVDLRELRELSKAEKHGMGQAGPVSQAAGISGLDENYSARVDYTLVRTDNGTTQASSPVLVTQQHTNEDGAVSAAVETVTRRVLGELKKARGRWPE
jgi:hypothetical protein